MRRAARTAFFLILILILLSLALGRMPTSNAQQLLGSITGTVTDSSGAVLAQVQVRLHEASTGLELAAVTNRQGAYSLFDLPIGTYQVTFSKQGFQSQTFSEWYRPTVRQR